MLQTPLDAEASQPGSFAAHAGFAPEQIVSVGFYEGMVPSGLGPAALRLNQADAGTLSRAWIGQGYTASGDGPARIWTRGEPGRVQLDQRDPADPLRNRLGTSAILGLDRDLVLMAPTTELVAAMRRSSGADNTADRTDVRPLLDGLDRTLGPADRIVSLYVMAMPDGTAPLAPDADKGAIDMPPYASILFGEVLADGIPQQVFALPFPDCPTADQAKDVAAARLAAALTPLDADLAGRGTDWSSVPVEGGCVVFGRVGPPSPRP